MTRKIDIQKLGLVREYSSFFFKIGFCEQSGDGRANADDAEEAYVEESRVYRAFLAEQSNLDRAQESLNKALEKMKKRSKNSKRECDLYTLVCRCFGSFFFLLQRNNLLTPSAQAHRLFPESFFSGGNMSLALLYQKQRFERHFSSDNIHILIFPEPTRTLSPSPNRSIYAKTQILRLL